MEYKQLGHSGLRVSSMVMGTMTFGDGAEAIESARMFHMALDAGINMFDCANLYAKGHSEEILNPLIKNRRSDVLVSSKAYFPVGSGPNDRGCSRHHLTNALHDSLRRLGTDYIDIYYLHHFDESSPLEESLRCLEDFVRAGKIRYIGFSNFSAWQYVKALSLQQAMNLNKAVVIQPMYNLLKRQAQVEILPMAKFEGLGVLSYSPLGAGLLTGKYARGQSGRLQHDSKYQSRYRREFEAGAAHDFVHIAQELAVSPATLALAWVMANPLITAPIVGATTCAQLKESLAAAHHVLAPETYRRLSALGPQLAIATDRAEEEQ